MIYNHAGVPLKEVLLAAALAVTERKNRRRTVVYSVDNEGNRLYRILHTKLGDAYRVFRALLTDTNRYSGARLRGVRKGQGHRSPANNAL
jgi:hypothetical protein